LETTGDRIKPHQYRLGKLALILLGGGYGLLGGGYLRANQTNQALAQVSADRTLPQSSVVNTDGNTFNITGGTVAGTNLFHSFDQFSLNTGQTAYFQNEAAIANILSRVTGNNASNIDGLIRANGNANLFLVNPNGILFGENARLDLGGSFIATSADAIEFASGDLFPARDTGTPPLLTMSVPVGLQFNQNTEHGAISVEGQGHNLTKADPIFAPVEGLGIIENGLKVLPGQNLALIGNGINLNGGLLSAAGANIELASLAIGKVNFIPAAQGWNFSYEPIAGELSFSDMNLRDRAVVDGSGFLTSSINLHARDLTFENGSLLAIQNQGIFDGSDIQVQATGDMTLIGTNADAMIQSAILSTALAPGQGGAILVNAENLSIVEGAIASRTFSDARSGDVDINVGQNLRLVGVSPVNPRVFGSITATTLGAGRSGDIRINTRNLVNNRVGVISASTAGSGSSGDIYVVATESIELSGAEPFTTTPSAITAATFSTGQAGNVVVDTKNLVIDQGGLVDSSTVASGNAGSVEVNASESIRISGDPTQPGTPGVIASASAVVDPALQAALGLPPVPTGNSGNVTINTGLLQATTGGLVNVISNGPGNPGRIRINSDRVSLSNRGGIIALTDLGSGGNIEINTGDLDVFSAFINASSIGTGDAGNILIDATGTVTIREVGFLPVFSALFVPFLFGEAEQINLEELNGILSIAASDGNAGDIEINANQLTVRDGGLITTTTVGNGRAGNLNATANQSILLDGGLVVAASAIGGGSGGNLEIISPNIKLSNGGLISSVTLGAGDAGTLIVRATEALEITDSFATGSPVPGLDLIFSSISSTATATASGNGSNLIVITPNLIVRNDGVVAASAAGSGNGGNLFVQSDEVLFDRSNINASSASGQGGNIDLQVTDSLILRNASTISATAGLEANINRDLSGNGGNIDISVPVLVLLEGSSISANAFRGRGGNIDILTSGLFTGNNTAISASSQLGVDGVVEVNSPDIDPSSGLVELETSVVDFSSLIAVGCDADRGNTFVATGRSGIAASPREIVRTEPSVIDWRSPFSPQPTTNQARPTVTDQSTAIPEQLTQLERASTNQSNQTNQSQEPTSTQKSKTIAEVHGWRIDQTGNVALVTDVANPNPSANPHIYCLAKKPSK
jgi:filamentous hemagglutinin family protein